MTLVTEKGFSVLFLCFIYLFGTHVYSQQLKPGEIMYSRMPTDMNAPPTGANSPTVWIVGQDGSNDRFITNGTMPRISDDGRFLLFKRFSLVSFFNPFWIYPEFFIRDLSTGQETMIIPPSFDEPSAGHFFSPASNQGNYEIIYDCGENTCKINRDGTNRFRFPWLNANYSYDNFPTVRRGGDQLIALSNNAVTPDVGGLYTVEISGAPRQKIPNTTCLDFYPAWSNDNQFIAFGTIYTNCNNNYPSLSTYPYWVSNLFKIKPDGTGREQLTNFPTNPDCALTSSNCLTLGYVWTDDNLKLIAAGRLGGVKGLFAISTNGSGTFTQIPISAGNPPDFVGGIVQTRVDQKVLSSGGGVSATGQYSLLSTIGETIAGLISTGGSYSFDSGFWALSPDDNSAPTGTPTATPTSSPSNTPTATPTPTPQFAMSGTVTYGNAVPAAVRFVSNVLINGAGSVPVSTFTDAPGASAGQYMLTGFGSGAYTVTPSKTGGVNGAISSFDAARIAQHASGPPNPQLTGNQLIVADVSGNGSISSFDAAQVAKFVAGPPFSAPGIGSVAIWKFIPVNRNYPNIASSITGEDYTALLMGEVSGNWANTGARSADRGQLGKVSEPEKGVSVELPSLEATIDKEVVVPVTVNGIADKEVISYEFDLRYDPSVIQPLSEPVDLTGTASRLLSIVSNTGEPGLLRVVVYGAFPLDGDGALLNLRFSAVGAVGALSPLTFERIMFNEGEPRVIVTNGLVELY